MNLLIDTHALIWFFEGNERLSRTARTALEHSGNNLWVSAASGYEVLYKQGLGKLPLPWAPNLPTLIVRSGIRLLPITMAHALAAGRLPGPHRDPWDRILMAQADLEKMTLVSMDPIFREYRLPILW